MKVINALNDELRKNAILKANRNYKKLMGIDEELSTLKYARRDFALGGQRYQIASKKIDLLVLEFNKLYKENEKLLNSWNLWNEDKVKVYFSF